MISIRKFLEGGDVEETQAGQDKLAKAMLRGYRSALQAMGRSGAEACPALGEDLMQSLAHASEDLSAAREAEAIGAAEQLVRSSLETWGGNSARHYQKKAREVKEMLLVMARTAESAGERDQRCARQIHEVTAQLKRVADLDDLTEIRASIERSAAELKTSIDRMTAEGEAVLERLRTQVSDYQARLEEAEQIASRDALTHVCSRLWVEGQIEDKLDAKSLFSVAVLDIDGFKHVNDEYGHLVGDELLKQFASELRAACRSGDVIGRWGGDEFIVLLDCSLDQARERIDRMSEWICGNYTVEGSRAAIKVRVDVSIGVAEVRPAETMKQLLDRADADMYQRKAEARERAKAGAR